jgi:hypothetical protein
MVVVYFKAQYKLLGSGKTEKFWSGRSVCGSEIRTRTAYTRRAEHCLRHFRPQDTKTQE